MTLAVLQLLAENETLDEAAVDKFLASQPIPIVEGPSITFLFRGEADDVRLRHFVYGLPAAQSFHRLDDTNLWYLVFEVPPGSRFEYKFEIVRGRRRSWIRDPLNPRVAHDPFGSNSVCHGAGYEEPRWALPDHEVRAGRIEEIFVPAPGLGGERRVLVYLPYRMRPARRYPLLVVFDGPDYLRYARLQTILDNLMHRHEVRPTIVALVGSTDRLHEYAAHEPHSHHVMEELIPFMEQRYPLRSGPDERGLMGASLGAVAAFHAAWSRPGRVGRLLLQSGSFAFTDIGKSDRPSAFDPIVEFVNALRAEPGRPADHMFVTCGMYESLIYENRSLVSLLQQQPNLNLRYVESRDGHNWENWRDRLREGLSWLFPGPLDMIYD